MPKTNFRSSTISRISPRQFHWACSHCCAIDRYHSRTLIAGLSRKRLKRRAVLTSIAGPGDLSGDLAQVDRFTLIDPDHQPEKVPYLRNSLVRSQFTNSTHPVMIEFVDRHSTAPVFWSLGRNLLYSVLRADQHSFIKLSGS